MKSIDHFTIEHNDVSVTFVRIANYLGWHGHYFKPDYQSDEYGAWIILADEPLIDQTIHESCEVLADQAANTLITKRGSGDSHSIALFIREKLKNRSWK